MNKHQKFFMFMIPVVVCLFILGLNCEAAAHKPIISGNFEQGGRVYAGEDGEGNDYQFKDGWLKIKQDLSHNSYFYLKASYSENDFSTENRYDSTRFDLTANYTRQLMKPLRLKTDIGFKNTNYPSATEKGYREVAANLELTFKLDKADEFTCSVKLQEETYPLNNKDNLYTGLNLKWERKVNSNLTIHSTYSVSGQNYFDETSLTDRTRQAISLGFEYQL